MYSVWPRHTSPETLNFEIQRYCQWKTSAMSATHRIVSVERLIKDSNKASRYVALYRYFVGERVPVRAGSYCGRMQGLLA